MKKTFNLINPRIKYPRMVEAAKNEIRKYIKRERRKELPKDVDFWDFSCKYGDTEKEAKVVHITEIDKCIDGAEKRALESFYVEVLSKPGKRMKKKM